MTAVVVAAQLGADGQLVTHDGEFEVRGEVLKLLPVHLATPRNR